MNILSLKGGGTRGIILTRFLMEIETITKKPIYQLFDYIGGASVGTLVACGILISEDNQTAKHTAYELHQLFLENITNAFSWSYYSYITSIFGLLGPVYTNDGLKAIIQTYCQDKTLKSLLKPIIFPTYDRIKHKTYYFDNDKDADITLENVIISCSAAPLYFRSNKMNIKEEKYDFLDSGVVVNNTSELVYLQATKNLQIIDKSKILLLNIGTGKFESKVTERDGLFTWLPNIVETLMNACNENEMYELSLSLPEDNYFIMDVPLDLSYYSVDDIRKTTIDHYIQQTELWINTNKKRIEAFCNQLLINKNL